MSKAHIPALKPKDRARISRLRASLSNADLLPRTRDPAKKTYQWNQHFGRTQNLSTNEEIKPADVDAIDLEAPLQSLIVPPSLQTTRRLQTQGALLKRPEYENPTNFWSSMRSRGPRRSRTARAVQEEREEEDGENPVKARLHLRPFTTIFHQNSITTTRKHGVRSLNLSSYMLPGDKHYGGQNPYGKPVKRPIPIRRRHPKTRTILESKSLPNLRSKRAFRNTTS